MGALRWPPPWRPATSRATLGQPRLTCPALGVDDGGQRFQRFVRKACSLLCSKNCPYSGRRCPAQLAGAVSCACIRDHVKRTYPGRPSSSMRFSTLTATTTSVAPRSSLRDLSMLLMTRWFCRHSCHTSRRELDSGCRLRRPRNGERSARVGAHGEVWLSPGEAPLGAVLPLKPLAGAPQP